MPLTLIHDADVEKLKNLYIGEYVDLALHALNKAIPEKAVTPVPKGEGDTIHLEPEAHRLYLLYNPETMLVIEAIDGA